MDTTPDPETPSGNLDGPPPAAPPPLPAAPATVPPAVLACHLLALPAALAWHSGLALPGVNVVGPLLCWLLTRERSAECDAHGRDAVNFNLVVALLSIPVVLISIRTPVIGWIAFAGWIALIGLAVWKAVQRTPWRYPVPFHLL